jgi:hypothetical protein
MGLLDEIEKKIQKHPIAQMSFEIRVDYLKAVAYFLAIDEKVTSEEKNIYITLIKLLDCEDIEDDLVDFLEHISENEFEEVFSILKEKMLATTYLLEIISIKNETIWNFEEERFIEILLDIFSYNNEYLEIIVNFIRESEFEDKTILNIQDILYNDKYNLLVQNFIQFYKLPYKLKKTLEKVTINEKKNEIDKLINVLKSYDDRKYM